VVTIYKCCQAELVEAGMTNEPAFDKLRLTVKTLKEKPKKI